MSDNGKPGRPKPLAEYQYPSREVSECPYPFYKALQEEAPVFPVPDTNEYLVSRYEDIVAIAQNVEVFSNIRMRNPPKGDPELDAIQRELRYRMMPDVLENDPPRHTALRKLAFPAFTPKRLRTMEGHLQQIADELIDGFIDRGSCEFVREFAVVFPLTVICDLLGIPRKDMDQIKRWAIHIDDEIPPPGFMPSKEKLISISRNHVDANNYFAKLCELRRATPVDDAISEMTQARDEDGHLFPMEEVVNVVHNLVTGGSETTPHMLSHLMVMLLSHPEIQAEVMADPARLLPKAIEETLRLESPAQRFERWPKTDVELRGLPVPHGSRVLLMWAAGNRDASRFADPDRFDLHRKNVKEHLAFGNGIHYCPGAPLARMEGVVAFRQLFTRLKNVRFAPEKNDFSHRDSTLLRALNHLHLEFERA